MFSLLLAWLAYHPIVAPPRARCALGAAVVARCSAEDRPEPPAPPPPPPRTAARTTPSPGRLTFLLSKAENVPVLLALQSDHADRFNVVHLASFWHRAGKLVRGSRSDRSAFLGLQYVPARLATLRAVPQTGPRELTALAWGAASASVDSTTWPELWAALSAHAQLLLLHEDEPTPSPSRQQLQQEPPQDPPQQGRFTSQGLSNTAWALAKARHVDADLFHALARVIARRAAEFNPQELSNIAWAFATVGHVDVAMLDAVAAEATARLPSFQPQGLSNIGWAFAKLGHRCPVLFEALSALVVLRAGSFKPQEQSNVAWAFATAGQPTGASRAAAFDAVGAQALRCIGQFTSQGMVNLVWSHATVGHANTQLFDALACRMVAEPDRFATQGLSNTAWAFATAEHPAPQLFDVIAKLACHSSQLMRPQEMSNLLWCAELTRFFPVPSLYLHCTNPVPSLVRRAHAFLPHTWHPCNHRVTTV